MTDVDTGRAKNAIRERVWALLEQENVVYPPGAHGRIPNFVGAEAAADRLAALPTWQASRVIKAVPDRAQLPVRVRALNEHKVVYMAVPKLASERPFYYLDPPTLSVPTSEAASSHGASRVAKKVKIEEVQPVDLVICGSVAVNQAGTRLGKGAGYSDLEVGLLQEAGLLGPNTMIATTVHSLQVLDEQLPESVHDFSVDLIVTPDEIIECSPPRRPGRIIWERLSDEQIAAIPALTRPTPTSDRLAPGHDSRN